MKIEKYTYVYIGLVILGSVGGFFWWKFYGCEQGCPIDSSWKWSLVRGGLIGGALAAILDFRKDKSKTETSDSA